jgi:secondary thiamine-phosphate synthase enzyme
MFTAELAIETRSRSELVAITGQIADMARFMKWQDGIVTVFVPHTTAGVTINENADPDVARDMIMAIDDLVPNSPMFRHGEGNSDAHIKASLIGSSIQVILRGGALWLGTWQGIYFAEFDGPRHRRVSLAFISQGGQP